MAQFHATVFGRVQGVGFRYYAAEKAKSLGIRGFVKNNSDGTVEVLAQGREDVLRKFEDWLRQGPSSATVKEAKVSREKESHSYREFSIEH